MSAEEAKDFGIVDEVVKYQAETGSVKSDAPKPDSSGS